jgi:hypothetical protein
MNPAVYQARSKQRQAPRLNQGQVGEYLVCNRRTELVHFFHFPDHVLRYVPGTKEPPERQLLHCRVMDQ